ncbi:MAG: SDR family NAD(P)-dependent oxidoreductase, partial [Cytophagales bacterium]
MNKPVIWITGASSGIGEASAKEFSRQGYSVIISARKEKELERVKNECPYPESIRVLPLDLIETTEMEAKVKDAISFFGKVDILLHNGGISQRSLIR